MQSFRHNSTGASNQKTSLAKVVKEYVHGDHLICNHLVTKCSFCHNLNEATKQKIDLTIVVEEYARIKEIL